jgi:TolB protein
MRYVWFLLAFLTLGISTATAEDPPPHLAGIADVGGPGDMAIPLALPLPAGSATQSSEFWNTVKRDLELSGYFRIIPTEGYIEPVGASIRMGEFQFSDWRTVGAAALAKSALTPDATGLRAEVWIYDVGGASKMAARAFTAPTSASRSLAHRVANEIMYALTGHKGFFDTRIACVGAFSGNKEIFILDIDGSGRRQITKNGSINLKPRWSPLGNAIAFTSYYAGNPDLYIADLASSKIKRISARNGINTGGTFSPDGSRLAITLTMGGDPDIYILDAATGNQLARVTDAPGIDTSPTWSPDGSQLAFVSDRGGGPQIYVVSASGGAARRVSFQGAHNTDPSWSPQGDKIAFVGRDGGFDVFTVGVDGKGMTRITQGKGDNEDPSWSPDGDYLAFSSTRTGSSHIWISSADGRHQIQVTTGGGGYSNPHWSPHLSW